MKTYHAKTGEHTKKWFLVDLEGKVLGRAATAISDILRGKHRPYFTPHIDAGDFVIAINADKVKLTGNKMKDKVYYNHSGYIGGLKEQTAEKLMEKHPEDLIYRAVKGMIPHNALGRQVIKKFKVYAGAEHPHEAQNPEKIDV